MLFNKASKIAVKKYILGNIDGDGYDVEPKTPKQKMDFLMKTFKSEYGWAIERYGITKAMTEWLMGLPSAIHIDFYNYDILKIAESWRLLPLESKRDQIKRQGEAMARSLEKREDDLIAEWFTFLAINILRLADRY